MFVEMACEMDCCVCGNWFPERDLQLLQRDLVTIDVQRRCLNSTLNEIYLCKRCSGRCDGCQSLLPSAQKQKCTKCEAAVVDKKRKTPSRR